VHGPSWAWAVGVGAGLAWLIVTYRLPGRAVLEPRRAESPASGEVLCCPP